LSHFGIYINTKALYIITEIGICFLKREKSFLKLKTDTPKVFYIWGHAYEFDIYPERWKLFEEFCKMISNRADMFYGSNKEVFL